MLDFFVPKGSYVTPEKILKAWNKMRRAQQMPVIKQTTDLEEEALELASKYPEEVLRKAVAFRGTYNRSIDPMLHQEISNESQ